MKRAIFGFIVLLLVSKAFCSELSVPGQYSTIQWAINAASPGDTVIISPGTYTGYGNYSISFSGKAIIVRSVDPNDTSVVESTVIDCNGLGRAFSIDANVVIDGLTITRGAGGISISAGAPLIRNCNIRGNNASSYGGGIYCSGTSATVTIIDSNISGNSSAKGGGIYSRGAVVMNNCKIVNNQAVTGGGLYFYPSSSSSTSLTADRSLIAGNIASGMASVNGGGGIYALNYGTLGLGNSIVAGNYAKNNGGGLYTTYYVSATAKGCTFAGNAAGGSGGGAYADVSGKILAFNSIFWGNSDASGTGSGAQLPSTTPSLIFCCIQDNDQNDANIPFGGANNGNIDDDPMFVRMPSDGGDGWGVGGNDDYGDLHLRPDSPCIDKCSPIFRPGPNDIDIDGEPRLAGSAVDMGADEYSKIIVVTKPAGGEVWATGSKHPIKWSRDGVRSVDVLFSSDNGNNWETIAANITDTNSYLWQVPKKLDSNQCVIAVLPSDGPSATLGAGDTNVISRDSGLFSVRPYPHRPAFPPGWGHWGRLPAPNLEDNKGPKLGCLRWVFDTNGPVSSQVAVTRPDYHGYKIYAGCEDGLIYTLSDDGQLLWSYDINSPILGSPAVGYFGMVYVAGQNGKLSAIDDAGNLRWTHTTNGPIYSTPVVGYDGEIYVCSEDGTIYALDADGSELWSFSTKGPANLNGTILATPVIDKNGTVYIGGLYEPNLYALDANNGSVKWVCNFGAVEPNKGQILASPAIGPNGTIYQTLVRDPNLYAVDPCTGNILWSTQLRPEPSYYCASGNTQCCSVITQYLNALKNHTTISPSLLQQYQNCDEGRWQGIAAPGWVNYTNSSGWSSPVVGSDGTIYVSFDDPYLRAVEPNGTIKWITRLGLIGGFTLALDRDGLIYAASDDNFVCVVDSNGREVSRFQGKGWVSFPAIAEDGTLIVSDANNRVWAITSNSCDGQSPVLHTPADLRANNMVDFIDFAVSAESWRKCTDPFDATFCAAGISKYGLYAPGDVDRDAYINIWDLNALVDEWLTQSEFE